MTLTAAAKALVFVGRPIIIFIVEGPFENNQDLG
jgi:hypothetical protein